MITVETLRQLLDYNPETGAMTWRTRPASLFSNARAAAVWNGRYAGKPAFTYAHKDGSGRLQGAVFNRLYAAHRIAWALHTGKWPTDEIDHINGQAGDNRIENLREVSRAENSRNLPLRSDNTSGVIGVQWHPRAKKWMARIGSGPNTYLGLFETIENAAAARRQAERERGYHQNHGRAS